MMIPMGKSIDSSDQPEQQPASLPLDPLLPPPPLPDENTCSSSGDSTQNIPAHTADAHQPVGGGHTLHPADESVRIEEDTLASGSQSSPQLVGAAADLATSSKRSKEQDRLPEIPGYDVLEKLGQGGMGAVYRGRDQRLGRQVAIKVILTQLDETNLLRFEREVTTVAGLQHPNIAQLFAAETDADKPYYVMELVEGDTLEGRIGSEPQSPRDSVEQLIVLARAIDFCHQRQIIHRDLKPSNVLIDEHGVPKLTDFGLAKTLQSDEEHTRTGDIMGTPGYMAPEQASGVVKQIGPGCDIYGLGAILYRMLTGRAPFTSPDPMQTVLKVLSEEPVAPRRLQPELPRDLETICLKCLEKKTARRYETAAELCNDLQRYLEGQPILARPAGAAERLLKWARRRPAMATMLAMAAVLIPLVIVGQWYYSDQLKQSLARSNRISGELNVSLENEQELNQELDAELSKSMLLANEGSDLSMWVLEQHLQSLRTLPGTTRLRYDLIGRVQTYLDETTPHVPAESKFIRRQARTYHVIADIQGNPRQDNIGEKEIALENYGKAIELFDRALELDPQDSVAIRLRAACLFSMSDLVYETQGGQACDQLIAEALEAVAGLPPGPADEQVIMIQSMAAGYEIEMLKRNERLEDALRRSDQYLVELEAFSKLGSEGERPRLVDLARHEQISALIERQQIFEKLGELESAAAEIAKAVALANEAVVAEPDDPERRNTLAVSMVNQADVFCKTGQFQLALEKYADAAKIRRQLVAEDPGNQNNSLRLALSLGRLAEVNLLLSSPSPDDPLQLPDRQKIERALAILDEVTELRRSLVEAAPGNRQYQREFWQHWYALGQLYGRDGRYEQAIECYQQVSLIARQLVSLDSPDSIDVQGQAQAEFGLALAKFQRFGETIFSESEPFEGNPLELDDYKSSLEHIGQSLKYFERLAEMKDLDSSQEAFRQSVEETGQLIRETAKKFGDLINGGC